MRQPGTTVDRPVPGDAGMDEPAGRPYVGARATATGLIDMRARVKRRISTLAASLLLMAGPGSATTLDTSGSATEAVMSTEAADYDRGMQLFHAEQYDLALPYFVSAVGEARSRFGEQSSEHATALNNLGEVYRRMKRYEEAEPLFVEALAIDERRLGPDHQGLARPLNNLALVQRARGQSEAAERNHKRSLQILEETFGRFHPDVAGSLNNLARLYETTGHAERAQPLLERALPIATDTLGPVHPTTRRIAENLRRVTATLAGGAPARDPMPDAGRESAADATPVDLAAAADGSAETPAPRASLVLPPDRRSPPQPASTAPPLDLLPVAAASAPRPAIPPVPAARPQRTAMIDAEPALPPARELPPAMRPAGLGWQRLPDGAFAMHLASVRSPVSATAEWQRLASLLELPAAIHQLEPQRIETAEQGVFYRVLGGPFRTSEAAAAACGAVRAKGAYCGVLADGD